MSHWVFYSPTLRLKNAGDLLRAIPSSRIWRLERHFTEHGERASEMVRAAEQLVDLDVTARLQNDGTAALSLCVCEPKSAQRLAYEQLETQPFAARDLAVVAELRLSVEAMDGGHSDICDDVLCDLEKLYPGGVVWSSSGNVFAAADIVTVLTNDLASGTHFDVSFTCDDRRLPHVTAQLGKLGRWLGASVLGEGATVRLRSRFPATLSTTEIHEVCTGLQELAKYATRGRVRVRKSGVWHEIAQGAGAHVVEPPGAPSDGMLRKLTRLLRQK